MKDKQTDFLISAAGSFLIFIVGFLLYAPTLNYSLTFLDDHIWVEEYQWFLKNWDNATKLFNSPDLVSSVFYRPLLSLSFMINAQFAAGEPFSYHLTNILIHILNAWLLFLLLREMEYPCDLCWGFALIFTVHPALTSAVAWIPGRTDSLLGLFVLGSFLSFLSYHKDGGKVSYILHLILFCAALLTKETAVTLPILIAGYIFLVSDKKTTFKSILPLIIGWGVISFGWFILRAQILATSQKLDPGLAVVSVLKNSPALITYFGKAVIPVKLSVLPVLDDMTLTFGLISLLGIIALLFISKNKQMGRVSFGFLWFLLLLIPSLVISFLKHEYRIYLPMIGVFFILLEVDALKSLVRHRIGAKVFFAGLAAVLAIMTWQYGKNYQDRISFWESAVESSPHAPLAHRNLGAMYYLDGRSEEAKERYLQTLKLNPREPMVHNNLGLILADEGKNEEAIQFFLEETAINPNFANSYFNLALIYYDLGKQEEAAKLWEKTIEVNPNYIQAYVYLSKYYLIKKDTAKARHYVQQLQALGIEISPEMLKRLEVTAP